MRRANLPNRLALPAHTETAARQTETKQEPVKLTAEEKKKQAADRKRFKRAVDELIDYMDLYEGTELSREDAERMVLDYAATHEGYYSEGDEIRQRKKAGTWKSDAQLRAERYEEDVKYSIRNTRNMTWQQQTNAYFGGKLKSSDSLYLGISENYLVGVDPNPLYIPTSIVTKAMREQKGSRSAHSMTDGDIRGLEKGIKEAAAIIYNPDRNALIYIAQEAEKGGQVIATFDLNNDLFGENAHRATSIHPRESIIPMLEKLGENSVIYVKNENKFNELAGLQTDNPPKLLARIELVENKVTESSKNVNSEIKESARDSDSSPVKFEMREPVEETDMLVAVHNKSVSGLRRMMQRGGVPFPSIAIKKAGASHSVFLVGVGRLACIFRLRGTRKIKESPSVCTGR